MAKFPGSHLFQYGLSEAPISPTESGTNDGRAKPSLDFGGSVVVGLLELSVSFPEYIFGLCLFAVLGCWCVALVVDEFTKDLGLLD